MKLCFVNLTDTFSDCHGLNYPYLSGFLKENIKDIEISVVDINFDKILRKIEQINPDIIGMTSTSEEYPKTIRMMKKIREIPSLSNTPVILGGVHISTLPESFHKVFDVGVLNEGDAAGPEKIPEVKADNRRRR